MLLLIYFLAFCKSRGSRAFWGEAQFPTCQPFISPVRSVDGHSSPCLPFLSSSAALALTPCMEEIDVVHNSKFPRFLWKRYPTYHMVEVEAANTSSLSSSSWGVIYFALYIEEKETKCLGRGRQGIKLFDRLG